MKHAPIQPEDYPQGPGYQKNSESSKEGARKAAPAKQTQEAILMTMAAKSKGYGVTYCEADQKLDGAIRPDVIRARLSSLKKAGRLATLSQRRMGDYGVKITPYCLPEYAPRPDDDGQGNLGLGG